MVALWLLRIFTVTGPHGNGSERQLDIDEFLSNWSRCLRHGQAVA